MGDLRPDECNVVNIASLGCLRMSVSTSPMNMFA